jgi:hypothetical protein
MGWGALPRGAKAPGAGGGAATARWLPVPEARAGASGAGAGAGVDGGGTAGVISTLARTMARNSAAVTESRSAWVMRRAVVRWRGAGRAGVGSTAAPGGGGGGS